MEYSKDQILFLDILIKRNEKMTPTNIQKCPAFTSGHSNHCKQNIPFCLARRTCTIVENNAEKLKNLENLKSKFTKYKYPDWLIRERFQKALSILQKDHQMERSCH